LVLGAGAEIEITSGLMLQLEYRYAMLNDGRIPLDEGVGLDVDAGLHSGRLGLLYRFDFLSR
jgi:opacity protein-like surface antigen